MPGYNAKVIVCCDPNSGLESIIPQLRGHNYDVVHAPSVFRAVSMHSTDPAEVVIIDANNFGENDYEVFDVLRESLPEVRLFASISMGQRARTPVLLKRGVESCFLEPFYADEILSALDRALRPAGEGGATSTPADRLAALGRFARGVAHEINNPLTTLSGWVQILVSETTDKDPHYDTFEVMQQEVDRVAKVVQDLLAVSGQPSPQRDQVDINATIRGLVRGREADGVECSSRLGRSLPKVYANPDQLRDALARIIDFACTQMEGKGELQITTQSDRAEAVVMTLRATSASVDDETLNNMFDPFYSDNGEPSEGGLGLAISYGIIKGLGGALRAERDTDGLVLTLSVPVGSKPVKQGTR